MNNLIPAVQFNLEADMNQNTNIHNRILVSAHISDLHFPNAIDPKIQYQILDEQFLDKIAFLPRLDAIFINGDLFDHKVLVSSDAAYYASLFIANVVEVAKNKGAVLVLLHGTLSHDANQLKLYYHYMHNPDVDVRIITKMQFEYIKGAKVLCIPELYGVSEEEYNSYLFGQGAYDLCVMHGTYDGAVYGNNAGSSRCFYKEDFLNCRGPVIAGHVHKPDCFDNFFYYCGSPYAWSFADDHDKGFILLLQNLDTRYHYVYREEIKSFIYRTFTLDSLIKNDPKSTIEYIENIRTKYGIDYIRIKFDNPVSGANKQIIANYFRNLSNYKIEFVSQELQMAMKQENEIRSEMDGFEFILDNKISDEEKFVMYVNKIHGDEYITIDELKEILSDTI